MNRSFFPESILCVPAGTHIASISTSNDILFKGALNLLYEEESSQSPGEALEMELPPGSGVEEARSRVAHWLGLHRFEVGGRDAPRAGCPFGDHSSGTYFVFGISLFPGIRGAVIIEHGTGL